MSIAEFALRLSVMANVLSTKMEEHATTLQLDETPHDLLATVKRVEADLAEASQGWSAIALALEKRVEGMK